MRPWYAVPLIALLGLLSAAANPAPARASCAARSPAELYAAATVVFRGKAVAFDPARTSPNAVYFAPTRVTFVVDRQWKGDVPPTLEVVVNYSGTTSGHVEVRQDQEFLVYALGDYPNGLYTDGCVGLRPIGDADDLLDALGPGLPPTTPGLPNTGGGAGRPTATLPAIGLAALLLTALGEMLMRRYRA